MRIIGAENLTQEMRDQLGACEVCGALALNFTRDIFVEYGPDSLFEKRVSPGQLHRRCEDHPHESRVIKLRNGKYELWTHADTGYAPCNVDANGREVGGFDPDKVSRWLEVQDEDEGPEVVLASDYDQLLALYRGKP